VLLDILGIPRQEIIAKDGNMPYVTIFDISGIRFFKHVPLSLERVVLPQLMYATLILQKRFSKRGPA
jgi:hypothetical protein